MKAQERCRALHGTRTSGGFHGSPPQATWTIGTGRVTIAELQAWQLGPEWAGSTAARATPKPRS